MDQLDIVQLLRTNRINFLSGPKNYVTSPHGNWTVVGRIKDDVIIAKDQTLARVPIVDVRVVGVYSIDDAMSRIRNAGIEGSQIDMVKYLSDQLHWPVEAIPKLLKRFGFPKYAVNEQHRDRIQEQLTRLLDQNGEDPWA
jgi:hypothetical protein